MATQTGKRKGKTEKVEIWFDIEKSTTTKKGRKKFSNKEK